MNYAKLMEAILERRNGKSLIPGPLGWALRHFKLVIFLVIGAFVLIAGLVIAVLIAALMYFMRGTPALPTADTLIQSGRQYLDQQFAQENQKLDQLQQDVRSLIASPSGEASEQ